MAQEPTFPVVVPDALLAGVYANFLAVWHTGHEFTLDFAVTQPPQEGDEGVTVPCLVTARIKLPVGVLFAVLQALNANMTRYEEAFGVIKAPEPKDQEEQGDQ